MLSIRHRRLVVAGALATLAAGVAPLPAVQGLAAPDAGPTQLSPTFPAPMPTQQSASGRRAPAGGPVDSRFVGRPPQQERSCRPAAAAQPRRSGARLLPRNGCATTTHDRLPLADEAYHHPHAQPADFDAGGEVVHAIFAGGPPPTYASPNWVQLQPAAAPVGRYGNAMAYDDLHQQVVLFGGYDGTTFYNDTWTWNGTTWTQQHPATSPPVRMSAQMAYDAATQTVILFGGSTTTSPAMGDTWAWNGTTWTQLTPQTSPPARSNAAVAYDTQASKVVLFGGGGYTPGVGASDLGDTWTYNGTTWAQVTSTPSPAVRSAARAAYDATHQTVVLFGGQQKAGTF
ncbi:MAG TPA: kelch repeat-containing protein, partial [Streptosporangiaceae bacterium]|nr:kelch repeat-containing protein [Streptosporangiaceae bacterium]